MSQPDLPHELLSAYVDGELTPEDAAFVARRAASDPAIARRLAMLQALRAEVAGMVPPGMLPRASSRLTRPETTAGRHMKRFGRLATAAALFALLIGAGWLAAQKPQLLTDAGPVAQIAQLIHSHDQWRIAVPAAPAPGPLASQRLTALMAETGLHLVHAEVIDLPDGATARHSGFLGSNGCRLSLFEIPDMPVSLGSHGTLAFSERGGLMQAAWQTGNTRYFILARDMDSVRFTTIASSLRTAVETEAVDEADLIASLAGARQRCLA